MGSTGIVYTNYPVGVFSSYVGSAHGYYGYQKSDPFGYLGRNATSYASGGPPGDIAHGRGPSGGWAPGGGPLGHDVGFLFGGPSRPQKTPGPQEPKGLQGPINERASDPNITF